MVRKFCYGNIQPNRPMLGISTAFSKGTKEDIYRHLNRNFSFKSWSKLFGMLKNKKQAQLSFLTDSSSRTKGQQKIACR